MDGQGTGMGSYGDPFFDLLHSTVSPSPSPSPSPSILRSNSSHGLSSPKKEDNPFSDFTFGQDDVLPSYDFHPVRSNGVGGSSSKTTSSISTMHHEETAFNGNKGRQSSPPRPSYASADPPVYRTREPPITYESSIQRHDQLKDALETATVAAVEHTMKKYVDDLLRVLEGMSGRLLQLEDTTHLLEHSVQGLKADAANNHGESEGKLRMLGNLIKEVQRGVQILRDKQEISEAHSQLVKLQLVKSEAPASTTLATASVEVPTKLLNVSQGQQQSELPVHQSHVASQQPPLAPQTSVVVQQAPPAAPQAPVDLQQQQLPALPAPPPQLPQQQPQPRAYPNSSPVSPPAPVPSQPYAPPPHSQQQPPHSLPLQSYNHPPHIHQQYTHQPEALPFSNVAQGSQSQLLHSFPQGSQAQRTQVPTVYHPTETSYPPTATQGPPTQPQSYQISPQQHGVSIQHMYDPSFGRSNSGQLTLPGPYVPQPHQGSPMYEAQALVPSSAYSNPNYRVAQPLPSALSGGSYPRLPFAQPIQQSLPHATVPSGSPLPQNQVRVDDVVGKVAAMGFSLDEARAVVRRLTENGQSAELNVVLDKLMNGGEAQPQRGWFSR